MPCEDLNKRLTDKVAGLTEKLKGLMENISDDVKNRSKEIAPDIDTGGVDTWVGVDIDVNWKEHRFILDLPEVAIRDQEIKLDLPQVTMKTQEIIFHTPSVRMERVKTGEYPEFYCDTDYVIPKCTVKFSPIYVDLPVPFMQEQKIILDLPEFKVDTTSFVMGIPEFKMGRQEIILHLPEFIVKNISVEAETARARGNALKDEAKRRTEEVSANFREQNKAALGIEVAGLFDCYRNELLKSRDAMMSQISGSITGIEAGISALVARGAKEDDATLVSMRANYATLITQRDKTVTDFQAKLAELDGAQQKAIDGLVNMTVPVPAQ